MTVSNFTESKEHPWQETIRYLEEERYEEMTNSGRGYPSPRSHSVPRVPGQSARPQPVQIDYASCDPSGGGRRRSRVGIFRAFSPYERTATESNLDSMELALQDTSKASSSTVSTASRSPARNSQNTSADGVEGELEHFQDTSPATKPPLNPRRHRPYPTAFSPNPNNPFADSPVIDTIDNLHMRNKQQDNQYAPYSFSHVNSTSTGESGMHSGGGNTAKTMASDSVSHASSFLEDPRFQEKLGLHILCAEATSKDDIAWRNALYLLGMQPPLAQVVDNRGRTALHVACEGNARDSNGHPASPPCFMIRALLVANKIAVRQTDNDGRLPIHWLAASSADADGLQLLVEAYPASITVRDAMGWTPLHLYLQNPMVHVTLAQTEILLGHTLPVARNGEGTRIKLRRGDHLQMKVEHLDSLRDRNNPIYDPLKRYKIPETVLNSYPEDVRVCLKRLGQWDKKHQRQKLNTEKTREAQDHENNISFLSPEENGFSGKEQTNPATMAVPSDDQLPIHMVVQRGLLDINLHRKQIQKTHSQETRQQPLILLVRVLISTFPEGLLIRDANGHTPLLLAMVTATGKIWPSQELLELLLGKRTSGFESLPSWAQDLPFPSQHIYTPPNHGRLSTAAERYRNPAMLPALDTGQLPLHIAAEEWGDCPPLLVAIYESYPGAIHVQDARGRMPLHILLQNYRRITPHPQVIALLLSDRVAQSSTDDGHLPFDLLVESASFVPLEPIREPIPMLGQHTHIDPFTVFQRFFQSSIMAASGKARASRSGEGNNLCSSDPNFIRRRAEAKIFLARLRSLPPWLRRQACCVPFVQDVLVDEMASPTNCAFVFMNAIFLALLLATFRRQLEKYVETTSSSVPIIKPNATFFGGSGEEILANTTTNQSIRYDPWTTLAVYGLSVGLLGFQLMFWWLSCTINEFRHLCLFNLWRWIDFLAVALVVLTTAMIHESFFDDKILVVGTAATGMLWCSVVGFLSNWWYGMAFFTGVVVKVTRMFVCPFLFACIFVVAFAEMLFTLGHLDCPGSLSDASVCTLRDAYQVIYYLVLAEPIVDIGGVERPRAGMILLMILFMALFFLFLLSFLVIIIGASKNYGESVALDSFWEPKLAFVLSSQDSRAVAGYYKKRSTPEVSSLDQFVGELEQLWEVLLYLVFGNGQKQHWYAESSSLWRNCCLKLLAAIFIPLWFVVGFASLGLLWPPQVRRFIFLPRDRSLKRSVRNRNEAGEFFTSQVSRVRNEVMRLKDMSYEQANDVQRDIQELKHLIARAIKEE